MITLCPYQKRAVEWLCQRPRGIIQIPAGGGKTLVAAAALNQSLGNLLFIRKVAWIAPTTETRDQAKSAIASFPDLKKHAIRVECVSQSLDLGEIDLIVVDECKHAPAPMWRQIIEKAHCRFGLDATPFTEDPERNKVLLEMFDNQVFKVEREEVKRLVQAQVRLVQASSEVKEKIDWKIDQEYQNRCRFMLRTLGRKRFKRLPWRRIPEVRKKLEEKRVSISGLITQTPRIELIDSMLKEIGARFEVYRHCAWFACSQIGIMQNKARNAAVVSLATKHQFDQTLILVNQVEHGEELAKQIPGSQLAHSKLGRKKRAEVMQAVRSGECHCLIATSLADEGLDLPCLNVLILVSGGRSKIKAEQRTGRVLRSFAGKEQGIVYDFIDSQHPVMASQSRKRVSLYKSLGYSIEQAEL